MANKFEEKYTIKDENGAGFIQIADDIVAGIAALAAMEVEGVARLSSGAGVDLATVLGKKNISKDVKLAFDNNNVKVSISFMAKYGYNLVKVSEEIQEKVKNSISTMTGLKVSGVDVKVHGIELKD